MLGGYRIAELRDMLHLPPDQFNIHDFISTLNEEELSDLDEVLRKHTFNERPDKKLKV